jgi:hypothetical protein
VGIVCLALALLALPAGFPFHQAKQREPRNLLPSFDSYNRRIRQFGKKLRSLDLLGAFLLLAASVILIFALEEGGNQYSWKSAVIVSSLAISLLLWVGFICWEKEVERRFKGAVEPVFAWRLTKNRFFIGAALYESFS